MCATLVADESDENMAKELSYVASLSKLIATADELASEAAKLRAIRKMRHRLLNETNTRMEHHINQSLGIGGCLVRAAASDITSYSVEIRKMMTRSKTQTSELQTILAALDVGEPILPSDARVIVGLEDSSGRATFMAATDLVTSCSTVQRPHVLHALFTNRRLTLQNTTDTRTFQRRTNTSADTTTASEDLESAEGEEELISLGGTVNL